MGQYFKFTDTFDSSLTWKKSRFQNYFKECQLDMLFMNSAIVFGTYQVEYTLILNLLKGLNFNYKWWLRCLFEA